MRKWFTVSANLGVSVQVQLQLATKIASQRKEEEDKKRERGRGQCSEKAGYLAGSALVWFLLLAVFLLWFFLSVFLSLVVATRTQRTIERLIH